MSSGLENQVLKLIDDLDYIHFFEMISLRFYGKLSKLNDRYNLLRDAAEKSNDQYILELLREYKYQRSQYIMERSKEIGRYAYRRIEMVN